MAFISNLNKILHPVNDIHVLLSTSTRSTSIVNLYLWVNIHLLYHNIHVIGIIMRVHQIKYHKRNILRVHKNSSYNIIRA